MSSTVCFNLDQSKNLSSGNGLIHILLSVTQDAFTDRVKTNFRLALKSQ